MQRLILQFYTVHWSVQLLLMFVHAGIFGNGRYLKCVQVLETAVPSTMDYRLKCFRLLVMPSAVFVNIHQDLYKMKKFIRELQYLICHFIILFDNIYLPVLVLSTGQCSNNLRNFLYCVDIIAPLFNQS